MGHHPVRLRQQKLGINYAISFSDQKKAKESGKLMNMTATNEVHEAEKAVRHFPIFKAWVHDALEVLANRLYEV